MSLLPPSTHTANSNTIQGVIKEQYVCANTRTTTAPIVVRIGYLLIGNVLGKESKRPRFPRRGGRVSYQAHVFTIFQVAAKRLHGFTFL